jgi:hypothetical protein
LTFLLLLLVSPLIFLLRILSGDESAEFNPSPPPPDPPQIVEMQLPEWWFVVRQIFLILSISFVIGLILYTYSKDRSLPLPSLRGLLSRMNKRLLAILGWIRSLGVRIKFEIRRLRLPGRPSLSFERVAERLPILRARSPRARIRRYYLTLLRRAEESGYRRSPQQTPLEYEAMLARELSSQQEALSTLTEAFIQARYNRREVAEEQVEPVRRAWRKIREGIRRARNRKKA